jgi:hypothetical protein
MQYIRYGPWGQLHPPETGNCWKSRKLLKYLTPKPYIHSYSLCDRQYIQYIRYCPWGQPNPPEMGNCWIVENFWDPHP